MDNIQAFTDTYINTLLEDVSTVSYHACTNLAPGTRAKIEMECRAFIAENKSDIEAIEELDYASAGYCFYWNRISQPACGHGFDNWDSPKDVIRRLEEAARRYGWHGVSVDENGIGYIL